MESYHFQFGRMSNLDLHPLNLPVSRLSPAKSSSSTDQYTNHHSTSDSAYSSFSGGSTIPDYPSPFQLDDLQSHSLHYTDLKYAKAKYSPTAPDSDSNSMDHLYRSMEAIAQQGPSVHTHLLPPPSTPARLDSFVITKNLENSRVCQSPDGQLADICSSQQTGNVEIYGVQAEPACVFSQHFQSYKAQRRRQSCPDGQSGKLSNQNNILEHPNNKAIILPYKSEETSQGVVDQRFMSKKTGKHHLSNHPKFYCGPEDNSDGKMMTAALIKEDPNGHPKKDDQMTRILRQPQLDEKISKETTPLLYHLTGALFTNTLKNKNDCEIGIQISSSSKYKQREGKDGQISPSSAHQQSEISVEQPNEFFYLCSTLDDSYKKYYKEKLKNAQSKVLRETSFRRRDLQLSWPHRIKQQTDKKLSVVPAGPSQSMQPNIDSLTQQLHKLQRTEKRNIKEFGQEMDKRIEKEKEKPQNIYQPQVPRVGCRKRLTADQKKLSFSEPEKLHQLADGPAHITCHSLDSEVKRGLSGGDHSLVDAGRKMFETRGRALSASNFSKATLKNFQQKALAAYMERKTGQNIAEPQQPDQQVASQRHSTAERLSDFSSRHNSNNAGSKKLHRPLSAGRILDSVSSSVKYAQFLHAQHSNHPRQSSWREESPTAGKSASVESLLDQIEHPKFFRARSISTPHAFKVRKHREELSTNQNEDILSAQRKVKRDTVVCHSHTPSEPDNLQAQMKSPRGNSLEELVASNIWRPGVLSKSSEQLDHLQGKKFMSRKERRTVSFNADGTHMEKNIPGEHTNNSQAGTENKLSNSSITHLFSLNDEIHMVPHITGSKRRDDTIMPMPSHFAEIDIIRLEARSKEQRVSLQDVNEMPISDQEISFSHEITTDPSLWISTPETNETKSNNLPSSETKTVVETHITLPIPCSVSKPTAITAFPDIHEVESSQTPAVNKEQDSNEKNKGNGPKCKLEWEVLVQKVVLADQSLARIFYPITNRKTALMLMEQLLLEDTLLIKEHYKKKQEKNINNLEESAHSTETPVDDKPENPTSVDDGAALSNQKVCNREIDIIEQKRQLISHIEEHLTFLEEARSTLQGEEKDNGARGHAIETLIRESCMPAEVERYTQFIGDLERVISLLLCLSSRLARVQNALSTVDDNTDTDEKQSLENRHHLLCRQRDDAKELKDNLDRRERVVSTFLSKQLTDTQLQEYRWFVQTKASLLIRQKDLDERQRLGEEQLEALVTSIP